MHVASIFRKEKYVLEGTNMSKAASLDSHFRIVECIQGKKTAINRLQLKLEHLVRDITTDCSV
jgi:hypothetical protein